MKRYRISETEHRKDREPVKRKPRCASCGREIVLRDGKWVHVQGQYHHEMRPVFPGFKR